MVVLCAALTATMATTAISWSPNIRTVEQSAGRNWKHERSGMVFPAVLLDTRREAVMDTTSSEYDVFARYVSGDNSTAIVLHIYRPAVMSVPLWFDRAHAAIALGNKAKTIKPATVFAPPGSVAASGMRVGYAAPGGVSATAVALVPVADWLIKIVITGKGTADEVEARIDRILQAINLPDTPDAPAAAEVQPCGTSLSFSEARALEPERGKVAAVAAMILAKQGTASDGGWCLEGRRDVEWTSYRRVGSSDGYLFTLGDTGRAFEVETVPAAAGSEQVEVVVTLTSGDRIVLYPPLSGFPSPQQAVDLLSGLRPVAQISRDNRAITLLLDETQAAASAGAK